MDFTNITPQKIKFSVKIFFSICEQICRFVHIYYRNPSRNTSFFTRWVTNNIYLPAINNIYLHFLKICLFMTWILIFNQVIVLMRIKDKIIEKRKKVLIKHILNHGAIILTRITCKRIPYCMHDSACRWRIAENVKTFVGYVKNFCNLLRVRYTESRLFYSNKF